MAITHDAVAPDGAADGFDWADAAIGAAVALGVAALAGWTLISMRRRPEEDSHRPDKDHPALRRVSRRGPWGSRGNLGAPLSTQSLLAAFSGELCLFRPRTL